MSKLSTRPPFVGTEIQDTDLFMIAIDNGDTTFTSQKIDGADLKNLVVPSTPASEVAFDKLTPTTAGVVFDPNTPTTTDILYYSTVDGSTWIYNGTAYVSKVIPNSTEFVLDYSFNDAGSNKTADISRNGYIKVRNDNTLLARFTKILSYGIDIISDVYAQIQQTTVSASVYPLTRMTRKRGTITSQTNALSGDYLGLITFNGGARDSANLIVNTTENHGTNSGTSMVFQTTKTGESSVTNSMTIDGNAEIVITQGLTVNYANASQIAYVDASKKLLTLSTATYPSLTELAYVKGVTSSIQTQIDGKAGQDARVQSVTSSAIVTPTSANDLVKITAQATGLTLANPTGTFTEGQALMIRINGTAQTIAFDTNYRAIGITLPTTTVNSKTMYIGIIYNSTDAKWDIVGLNQQS